MTKKYIGLAVFALLAGITVAIFSSQKESNWPSAVGFNYQPPKNIVVSPLTMAPEQSLPEQTLEGSESNINPSELTTLSEEFFIDKWTVAFIGFTYCPDICPAAMNNLARLEKAIAEKDYADDFQVLFISVDPQRDTLEKISQYTHFFSPTFKAATGSLAELEAMTNSMNLLFLIPEDTSQGNYLVDHSASFALISPQGQLVGNLREINNIDLMVAALDSVQ